MSYIFEDGEDDYTMENVMSQAKDLYPAPEKTRAMLSFGDRVVHDQRDELQRTIRTYLLRYCRDYNVKTTELKLRATLYFVPETRPHLVADEEAAITRLLLRVNGPQCARR